MLRVWSTKNQGIELVTCFVVLLLWVVVVSSRVVEVDYTMHDHQDDTMPDDINVTVSTGTNTTASLRLSRVPHINLDFPLYTLNRDGTGKMLKQREKHESKSITAFYQDMATDAMFQITRNEKHKDKKDLFKLKGEFKTSGKSYFLKSEKRMKSYSKPVATSTTPVFTMAASSSPQLEVHDEVYTIGVQKILSPTTDDFLEAPPDVMIPKRQPTISNISTLLDQDYKIQDIKTDILSNIKSKVDTLLGPSLSQPQISLDSIGSPDGSENFGEPKRPRRSTPTYAVDVAAVVDYSIYVLFLRAARNNRTTALQNIREYFAFVSNGMDLRYQSIKSTFVIRVYLSQVLVAESPSTSPLADTYHTGNSIDSERALQAFKNFVAQRAKDIGTFYDHAMLFTGYDLTAGLDHSRVGIAYISTLCKTDGSSVSVVEETLDYQSIILATHELAHSLSSHHDGEGNLCSFSDRYIMAAVTGTEETPWTVYHPWEFSACSAASFTSYVRQLMQTSRGQTCLTGHPPMDTVPDVRGRLLGQEIPPDQQCQATYGPRSKLCRGLLMNGPEICHNMYCLEAGTDYCYPKEALDGTTCGDGKVCLSGRCVYDPQAPTVDEGCMFGDESGIVHNGMTCQQFIKNFPGECYRPAYERICCKSCQAVYKTVHGCEYGDRQTGCKLSLCHDVTYSTNCCETCNKGVPFTTHSTNRMNVVTYASRPINPTIAPTDDACRNKAWDCYFLKSDAVTKCYDEEFKRNCCQFCQQHQTYIPGCEYGNHKPELCRDKSICNSNATVGLCCQLCATPLPITISIKTEGSSTKTIGQSVLLTIMSAIGILLQKL